LKISIDQIQKFKVKATGVIYENWRKIPSDTKITSISVMLNSENFFRPVEGVFSVDSKIYLEL
jgi:hypothetical protein